MGDVTTSQVLWGDVCQAVDPDPELPYPVFNFGGRIEKSWPLPTVALSDGTDMVVEGDTGYFLVTQANVRLGI